MPSASLRASDGLVPGYVSAVNFWGEAAGLAIATIDRIADWVLTLKHTR
jgi:hypothetical protein